MKTLALALAASSLILAPAPLAQEKGDMRVEVAGVQVIYKTYPERKQAAEGNFSGGNADSLIPFNAFEPGVAVGFLVTAPKGGLSAIDVKASKIASFADDKGTVLWDAKGPFNPGFGAFPKVSPDGKAALFSVEGKVPPAKDATRAVVKGTVMLKAATRKSTHKADKVALKEGGVVKVGPFTFTIEKASTGSSPVSLDLKTSDDLAKLVQLRFLGPDGKEIKADQTGRSSSGFGGRTTTELSYQVATELDTLTVAVEAWDDLKSVEVPFQAAVPIGTGK